MLLGLSFEFSAGNELYWGNVKLYVVFRLLFYMLALIIILFVLVQLFLWGLTRVSFFFRYQK